MWSDEFNGPADTPPDPSKWTYDLGNNNGWGNNELETYTNLLENAHMDGQGDLVIHVESTPVGYQSARLKTQGLFAVQYGRIEARIKLPSGQGIWPAFWMLGSNFPTVGWPQCGEIDIMENIGSQPSTNHGSMHGPGYSGGNAMTTAYTLPGGRLFSDDFHTFAIEWSRRAVWFFVDGVPYETVTPLSIPKTDPWVFDHPFFLLLNVAVGGNFPGPPNATTQFPQDMLIDYVRVYEERLAARAPAISLNGVFDSASFSAGVVAAGELATIFGSELANPTSADLYDPATGAFARSFSGTQVLINGLAGSIVYASPSQINFQIPWESLTGIPLRIEIQRDGTLSNGITVTLPAAAPSFFGTEGVATASCVGGQPSAGAQCSLWGTGFGPTMPPQVDGVPALAGSPAPTASPCTLAVGGQTASVAFCGAAAGTLIDRIDFTYPAGVFAAGPTAPVQITINGNTGTALLSVQ